MIFLVLALLAAYTIVTGPACEEFRNQRQKRLDCPVARIVPIQACKICQRISCPWHL